MERPTVVSPDWKEAGMTGTQLGGAATAGLGLISIICLGSSLDWTANLMPTVHLTSSWVDLSLLVVSLAVCPWIGTQCLSNKEAGTGLSD